MTEFKKTVINECLICKKDADGAFVRVSFRKDGKIQHGVLCTDGNRDTPCLKEFRLIILQGKIDKV